MFIFPLYPPEETHAQCGQFFLRPVKQNWWFIDSKRFEVYSLWLLLLVKSTMDFTNFIVSLFIASQNQEWHRRFYYWFPPCCHSTLIYLLMAREREVCNGSETAPAHRLMNNCTEHRFIQQTSTDQMFPTRSNIIFSTRYSVFRTYIP